MQCDICDDRIITEWWGMLRITRELDRFVYLRYVASLLIGKNSLDFVEERRWWSYMKNSRKRLLVDYLATRIY